MCLSELDLYYLQQFRCEMSYSHRHRFRRKFMFFSLLQGWAFGVMGQNLAARIKISFFKSVLRQVGLLWKAQRLALIVDMKNSWPSFCVQEIGWHDLPENNTGKIMSALSNDTTAIKGGYYYIGVDCICLGNGQSRLTCMIFDSVCIWFVGAVGDQIGVIVQNVSTVVAACSIAFSSRQVSDATIKLQQLDVLTSVLFLRSWSLTLVVLSVLPIMSFAQLTQATLLARQFSKESLSFCFFEIGVDQILALCITY